MVTDEDREWVQTMADREDQHGGFPGFSGRRPDGKRSSRGEVTAYDPARAMATVRLESGRTAQLHAIAFFSGRPSRLPEVGDRVVGAVVNVLGELTMVAARPQTGQERSDSSLIPQGLLGEAAFQLLASSTVHRYTCQALIYSRKAKLAAKTQQELRDRLQTIWGVLRQPDRDTRPVEEIEAALILVALWDQSEELPLPMEFHWVAHFPESDRYPGTEWLVGLTRQLQE